LSGKLHAVKLVPPGVRF